MTPSESMQAPAVTGAGEVPSHTRIKVLWFGLAVIGVAYIDRARISLAAPAIKADLGLTDVQMGYVFSAFTLAYALFEVPGGWMADRFGPRLTLTRIVIWWTVMSALTGMAAGFVSLFVIRLLFGMGEAGAFPSVARVYARWLPARERGWAFGLTLTTALLASALAQPAMGALLGIMSWRYLFPLFSVLGIIWVILWRRWFHDDPHNHPGVNQAELAEIGSEPPSRQPPAPWAAIFGSRNMLALCVMSGSWLYGLYFWFTWMPTYLLRARNFNMKAVGWLSALPLFATALGVVLGGWMSDRLIVKYGLRKGRSIPGLIGLPLSVVAVLGGVRTPDSMTAAVLLSLAAGLSAMGITAAWAVCLDIGRRHAGVVGGVMNMFGNLGATLSPIVAGWCVQELGSWDVPLIIVACLYGVAALCWLVIDPTKVLPEKSAIAA